MDTQITVNGLRFVPYLTSAMIMEQVQRIAAELRRDYHGKTPHFLCVLNGAFIFAADLLRAAGFNDAQISFIRYKSYEGTGSTGKVKQLIGLPDDISGQDVVIIEDIVDTGLTAERMIADLKAKGPASVRFVTLLHKPASTKNGFVPDYVAFSIPPKFIVGYGLDLDGRARNLPDIYAIKDE